MGQSRVTSGTGMSSGAGGVNSADPSSYSPNASSGQMSQGQIGASINSSQSNAPIVNPINQQQPLYGNVLGRGGSTTGGGARIRVEVANNPDGSAGGQSDTLTSSSNQAQSGDNTLSASTMSTGNRTSNTQPSSVQTEGVTTGGQAANQTSSSAADSGSSRMGNPSGAMMGSGAGVNCPPGMVPSQSRGNQPGNQSYSQPSAPNQPGADSSAPGRAFPNTRQNPQINP
jgi:hypothetical protein